MKAYLLKYTVKVVSSDFKDIKINYEQFFINKNIFNDYLNHKNALSKGGIFYNSKLDRQFNRSSKPKIVPPFQLVHVNKYDSIFTD